jgi:predicted HicB family RNase H-like nuclease
MPKPLEKEKRLAVRIEGDLHQAAHEQAAGQGQKLSDVIRDLLRWWIKTGTNVKDLDK